MQFITHTKVIANNRITIPKEIAEQLNIGIGDTVMFCKSDDGEIVLKKATVTITPAGC